MPLTDGCASSILLPRLAKAGWGDLAGRDLQGVRIVLRALGERLPDKAAQGLATAEQVAATSGYTERWTRRCLTVLEELDLIVWRRGTIIDGRPEPSWFRIRKDVVLALIAPARKARDAALEALRRRTADRIAGLRLRSIRRQQRFRRSARAELSGSLPPHGEAPSGSPRAVAPPHAAPWCNTHDMPNPTTASGAPGCPGCRRAAAIAPAA